jgi:hypothetical protein
MPKYVTVTRVWLSKPVPRVVEAGEILEYAGPPGSSMMRLGGGGPESPPIAQGPAEQYRSRERNRHLARLTPHQRELVDAAVREAA